MTAPHEPQLAAPRRAAARPDARLSTFLLTDIAGSTRLWEEHAEAMGAALAIHDARLRSAITSSGGVVVKTMGDGMLAVFDRPADALDAAILAQRALRDTTWGETGPLRVRMALHTGTAESREGDFFGQALNRDARILAIGHGGQILLSAMAALLAREGRAAGVELLDLGSHRLRDLDRPEQVFQVAVADLPSDFPPLRSLSTRRSNLPVPLTSFVGRERELVEVDRLLERSRLVTLIGTGGTGKTRLMIEVAGRAAARFDDGVWLAELASLGDPGEIGPEIARALGVGELPGRSALDVVAEFLASKDLLLVLDNAEHLIDGVARVTERLLTVAPGLRILTTSREALAVAGEAVVQVPSLSCPVGAPHAERTGGAPVDLAEAGATEAVQLFAERAAAVLPSFAITSANVDAVADICRRLDGIPARDRARRGPRVRDVTGGDREWPRRSVPAPDRRPPNRRSAPADPARPDRLELGSPDPTTTSACFGGCPSSWAAGPCPAPLASPATRMCRTERWTRSMGSLASSTDRW